MSILLAFLAASRGAVSVDTSLQRRAPAAQAPLAGQPAPPAALPENAAVPAPADNGVPLAR